MNLSRCRRTFWLIPLIALIIGFVSAIYPALAASVASYSSTNYDSDVQLHGQSGAGGTTTITATGSSVGIGNFSSNNYAEAQSFQVTAGILSQFTVTHAANSGSPTGTISWSIRADSSGVPAGTSLQSGTYTPVASSTNTITVNNGIFLLPSTTYWLVLISTNTQSGTTGWNIQVQTSSVYANGNLAQSTTNGSTWTTYSSIDVQISVTTASLSAKNKLAQSFTIASTATIHAAYLYLKKVGSPGANLTLRVETDSGGSPSGSLAGIHFSVNIQTASVTDSYSLIFFDFDPHDTLSSGTTYWLVLEHSGNSSNTDYVEWGADASSPGYADGEMKNYISSWAAESKDAIFDVVDDQGVATNTPTATAPTSTPTGTLATPTNTPTPTLNLYRYATLSNEQPVAVKYEITGGEAGIMIFEAIQIVILFTLAFLTARRRAR